MRPVVRGSRPMDENGRVIEFAEYREAFSHLMKRIGEYCSYCERNIPTHLAVEHIRPKDSNPGLEKEWKNLLLSCANCNSSKSTKEVDWKECFRPDRDNTFRAFEYKEGGIVQVASEIGDESRSAAQTLLDTLGLEKRPGNGAAPADRRWKHRLETWNAAQECLKDYRAAPSDEMGRTIVRAAQGRGFWSVWMAVFEDEPSVRRLLIHEFIGTCTDCFDANTTPRKREGGLI